MNKNKNNMNDNIYNNNSLFSNLNNSKFQLNNGLQDSINKIKNFMMRLKVHQFNSLDCYFSTFFYSYCNLILYLIKIYNIL